jgi:hypothetical protein
MVARIIAIVSFVVLPMLVNKTTEDRFQGIKPYLREIWLVMAFIYAVWVLSRPESERYFMAVKQALGVKYPVSCYIFVAIFGALLFVGYWWLLGRGLSAETNDGRALQGQNPTPPPTAQTSSGANSPNINASGDSHVTVTYTAPPATHPPQKGKKTTDIAESEFLGGGFRESSTGQDFVEVRIGGIRAADPIGMLKSGVPLRPIATGPKESPYVPITVGMDKDGKIIFNCTLIGGDDAHPFQIEIKNNVFKIASDLVQKNYNDKALEVADDDGNPLFQVIQEDKNIIRINGVFVFYKNAQGQLVRVWAWDDQAYWGVERPKDFVLKPIFKYPSWKYLGQYAD